MKYSFIIPCAPQPWQRPGLSRKRVFYDQQKHDRIALALFISQQFEGKKPISKLVEMDVSFYCKPPVNHLKPKNLGPNGEYQGRSDLDNFLKFLLDTITDARVWDDDKLLVAVSARKLWPFKSEPRTEFTIRELE